MDRTLSPTPRSSSRAGTTTERLVRSGDRFGFDVPERGNLAEPAETVESERDPEEEIEDHNE